MYAEINLAVIKKNDTPLAAKGREFRGWLKVFEEPRVADRNKSAFILALLVVIAIMALTLNILMPLKQAVPYFIESDARSGAVAVSSRIAREFKPETNHIIYFVKLFIRDAFTVDSRLTTELYFPEASGMVRGDATQQLRKYVIEKKVLETIATTPNFKRDVKLISVPSFISEGVILARYTLSDDTKRYAMTIHYTIIPPETDEKRLSNPIGFYITDFVINEEI